MRITERSTANTAIYNINQGRIKLDYLNNLIGSGKVVNRPSDDPVAAKKILELETQMKTTNQYISNIKTGQTWLDMGGTSLQGLLTSVMSITDASSQALSGAMDDPVKKSNILYQLKAYRDQLMDYPNAQVGSQYVFSGFKSDKAPFDKNTVTGDVAVGDPLTGQSVISNIDTTDLHLGMPVSGPGIPSDSIISEMTTPSTSGSNGAIKISKSAPAAVAGSTITFSGKFNGTEDIVYAEIGKGVTVPLGISGGAILRGVRPATDPQAIDIIKTLDKLMADISNGDTAGVKSDNATLSASSQQLVGAISDIGMRKARLDNALSAQQTIYNTLSEMHDNLQNIDQAKAAIQLTNQKTAFDSALAATAKISSLSLLNYL